MTKPELGTKRVCAGCSAKFYDLQKSPIVCPMCEAVFVVPKAAPERPQRNAGPKPAPVPIVVAPASVAAVAPAEPDGDKEEESETGVPLLEDMDEE